MASQLLRKKAVASDLNYGIAPFASNCTSDTSYSLQRLDLGGVDRVAGMIIQSTGRPIGESDLVVLAGTTTRAHHTSDIVLVRFAPDFVLPGFVLTRPTLDTIIGPGARCVDTGFGSGGKAIIDTGGNEVATGLVRQRDGKLIVSGWVSHLPGCRRGRRCEGSDQRADRRGPQRAARLRESAAHVTRRRSFPANWYALRLDLGGRTAPVASS